jgi:hypothetical protein
MKEHLVIQLKTQISDLERFIEFLQGTNNMCNTVSLILFNAMLFMHYFILILL